MAFMFLRESLNSSQIRGPKATLGMGALPCRPGLRAWMSHWVAPAMWRMHVHLPARTSAHGGRVLTGITIHPAAWSGANQHATEQDPCRFPPAPAMP